MDKSPDQQRLDVLLSSQALIRVIERLHPPSLGRTKNATPLLAEGRDLVNALIFDRAKLTLEQQEVAKLFIENLSEIEKHWQSTLSEDIRARLLVLDEIDPKRHATIKRMHTAAVKMTEVASRLEAMLIVHGHLKEYAPQADISSETNTPSKPTRKWFS